MKTKRFISSPERVRPCEVSVLPLYLALPGCEVSPIGVLLLDIKADELHCRINPTTEDDDASQILTSMTPDLVALAKEKGGRVVFNYIQESLSNVIRVGDCEEMYVVEHPRHAVDRIFSERVCAIAGVLDEAQRGAEPIFRRILLVEDNPTDVILIKEALREYAPTTALTVATDGQQALQYFESMGPRVKLPDLVLLDLSLPKVSGHEVLESLRADPRLKSIPVAVLSSSTWSVDIDKAYKEGANCYVDKGTDQAGLHQNIYGICSFFLGATAQNHQPFFA